MQLKGEDTVIDGVTKFAAYIADNIQRRFNFMGKRPSMKIKLLALS